MAKAKEEKKLDLAATLEALEKDYGRGAIIHGEPIQKYDQVVSTGSIGLDIALGIGGLPIGSLGKIIEIYGDFSSGKTTLIKQITGNFQRIDEKKVLYMDGENSIDETYAKQLGIDMDDLFILQLDSSAGEGAYDKMERLVRSNAFGLVVIDSVNAFKPKKMIEGKLDDSKMGLHARMMGEVLDKCNYMCTEYGCTFIFINQLREKIGVMFGNPITTQGGNAMKFYAHIRLETSRSTTAENSVTNDDDEKIANKHTVKVVKNKMAPPFRKAEFYIAYGKGVDKVREVMKLGPDFGIFSKHSGRVTYGDLKTSVAEFEEMISDNDDFYQELRLKILSAAGVLPTVAPDINLEENKQEEEVA